MKLYKYVGLEKALQILGERRLGFTLPQYLNDPFDTPMEPLYPDRTLFDEETSALHTRVSNMAWGLSASVLSLTRTPTNSLMWAHYADQHKGVVIGFDMQRAGLLHTANNIIPAHYGSMIYTRSRSREPYVTHDRTQPIGQLQSFESADFEMLQRLFLHKPLEWAYEEEVRVVKSVSGLASGMSNSSGLECVRFADNSVRYYLPLESNMVTDIIFGARSEAPPKALQEFLNWPSALYSHCEADQETYALRLQRLGFRLSEGGFA